MDLQQYCWMLRYESYLRPYREAEQERFVHFVDNKELMSKMRGPFSLFAHAHPIIMAQYMMVEASGHYSQEPNKHLSALISRADNYLTAQVPHYVKLGRVLKNVSKVVGTGAAIHDIGPRYEVQRRVYHSKEKAEYHVRQEFKSLVELVLARMAWSASTDSKYMWLSDRDWGTICNAWVAHKEQEFKTFYPRRSRRSRTVQG